MKTNQVLLIMALLLIVVGIGNAADRSYLIISDSNDLPKGLKTSVKALGGTVTRTIPQIGVAGVDSSAPNFAKEAEEEIQGIYAVVPNIRIYELDPSEEARTHEGAEVFANGSVTEMCLPLQWALDAIDAPQAWDEGAKGAGVRVAVLDFGMFKDDTIDPPMHPDLYANVNIELAKSFVPGQEPWNETPTGLGWHGDYVAGLIAAVDHLDDYGIIGVAPEAEIVPIKVLDPIMGIGYTDWVLGAIVYAADIECDIINMSWAGYTDRQGYLDDNMTPDDPSDDFWVSAEEVAQELVALNRATRYAHQAGVTLITTAHDDAIDLDHDKDWFMLPAQLQYVIAVSSTAPELWALNPETDLDVPASYTNYGQSVIDFAAPGGDYDMLYTDEGQTPVAVPPISYLFPAWVYDEVFGLGGYNPDYGYLFGWRFGTPAAVPHVSGVAALIIGQNGGSMDPVQVEDILRKSADDLGKPGKDDFYGYGRVNAYKAVMEVKRRTGF